VSVLRVVQWNVDASDREACDQALEAVAEHVKSVHPAAQGFRTYCHRFGPLRPWTYFAVFEFESVTAWDCYHDTPSCEVAWGPIYRLAQTGSFAMSFWSASQRESAPAAWVRAGVSEESGAPAAADGGLRR
jgi:hypothetical protein